VALLVYAAAIPRFSPATVHTHLKRIERLAHDLAHDMEKSEAAPSRAGRAIADCIKADIETVIRALARRRRS
jgi:hypothetical protein